MQRNTTQPIPVTDWFPATNEPNVIGRVVMIKRINVPESKKQRKEVYMDFPAIEHKIAGLTGDVSYALIKEETDPDNADHWIRRFSQAWDAFKGTQSNISQGMPLEQFTELPEGIVKALIARDMTTVEQLANASDATCEALGSGMRKYRTAARAFLRRRTNHGYGYVNN